MPEKPKAPKQIRNKINSLPYWLCLPAFILLVLFFLIPAINQLSLSFYTYIPPGTAIGKLYEPTFTLQNFLRLLTPAYVNGYLWPTLRIVLVATPIALILSYPVAYYIAKSSSKWKKIFISLTIVALLVGPSVRVYAWLNLLGKEGLINNALFALGLGRINFIGSELGVIIGAVHALLPYIILVLAASIHNINPSYQDAARSLGADDTNTFLKVTLPLSLPGIISAAILGLTLSATMLETPMVLGFGIVQMQGNLIYNTALGPSANYPFSAAASVFLIIIALAITYGVSYALKSRIKWMKQI